ncbi:aminotransferase class I/II-fold pyridoxal phosphate-dependent enzyme [Pedobacter deserti]|uniref:aminotransferase class I/II-fold pyridoxal phosphate-dependent enzyme n=1 Tax=Pedobacter deserti TaxID=2817382 RepID=UPI00210A948A|nr:aminotransferase class I/II-fold pyridoxal phosphate-dependent enzyme [Pedobacter sp. SYSU D00382]
MMSTIDYRNASFKDFEDIEGCGPYEKAKEFEKYIDDWDSRGHWNYRQESLNGCAPEVELSLPGSSGRTYVAMVFNDYLGFAQHPALKQAAIDGIVRYGVGAAASPAIGGHMTYHRLIEEKIAAFFKREAALLFTTGYTANVSTMHAVMKKSDLVLADMSVHASMYDGFSGTNVRRFLHNNMEHLRKLLKEAIGKFRTIMVVVDGVYSQPADLAPLAEIVALCKEFGALLAMDDAHGVGVVGDTGRGVLELHNAYEDVDLITGTFSKTFAHLGGYVVGSKAMINYLKFHARQHIFSVSGTPASACILKAIDLIDEEPHWRKRLWRNIDYLKKGLHELGLNTGNSASAIVPVLTGNAGVNAEVCRLLMEAGVYANQVGYPAVAKKDARIRMSVMATHTQEHLDHVLNAWEWVKVKANIKNFE